MKRFLSAGEGSGLFSTFKYHKPLIIFSLFFMCLQTAFANEPAPVSESDRAVPFHQESINEMQQTILSGVVIDTAGQPIQGVNVAVRGTRMQVTTDAEGRFSLQSGANSGMLVISHMGYQTVTQRFASNNTESFQFIMVPVSETLDEVEINAGYYNTTKRLSTGNIAKVDAATIGRQPITNPLQALNGQVSGVRLIQNHGLPGHPISIEIRGRNSIRSGNDPLYIVDGVPYNSSAFVTSYIHGGMSAFNSINPNDIESISILKDADATAIYGSRGANGVVLITTKRATTSQTTFNADLARGFGSPTRLLEPLSTEQYLQVRRDAFANSGIVPDERNAPDLTVWDQNTDNKLQNWLVGTTVNRLQSSLSLSGGTAQTLFKLSGNYHQENSMFDAEDLYKRGNVHFNLSHRMLDDKLRLNLTIFYGKDDNKLSGMQTLHLSNLANLPPNYPLLDDVGNYNWIAGKTNYVAQALSNWVSKSDNLNANMNINYDLLVGLKIKTNVGYKRILHESMLPTPAIAKNPASNPMADNSFTESLTQAILFEPQLDYQAKRNKHQFQGLLGFSLQSIINERNHTNVGNYINELLINSRSGGIATSVGSVHSDYRYVSLFSRLNYNWDERYILNLSARRDGSSRFGPGKRFGMFGSVGAAWLFAEESFIKNHLSWLSTGKLRGSYGTSGNDNIGDYAYLSIYNSVIDYNNQKAIAPNQLANDNYRWEVNRKLELATELGFWDNRLTMDLAWYRNRSDNQLVAYPLPATTGFTSYTANMPALVQNQGLELDVRFQAVQKPRFSWATSLNASRHRNKLLEFPNIEGTTYANSLVVGESLNIIQRYRFVEVDPQTGLTRVADVNGDGVLTSRSSYNNQNGDFVIVGSWDPKWSAGLNNSIRWRSLQLDFSLQYVKQDGYNSFIYNYWGFGQLNNHWNSYLDYWKNPGDEGKQPKPFVSSHLSLSQFANSDQVIGDASFLRLNNVSLSWNIHSWTLYANGQNLMTWTKLDNYDPEFATSNQVRFPPLKMLVFGVRTTIR